MKKIYIKNSQNGAVVVEAVFVFPLVFIVVFILLYMALVEIQQGILQLHANKMAQDVSKVISFPGYENIYSKIDSLANKGTETAPSNLIDENALKDVYRIHDPYRYWNASFEDCSAYEDQLKKIAENISILKSTGADASIKLKSENFSTSVTVFITYKFDLPALVSLLGVDTDITITASAVAYASDVVEFVRNTDIVFDLTTYLFEKFSIGEKIDVFYQNIKDMAAKLF